MSFYSRSQYQSAYPQQFQQQHSPQQQLEQQVLSAVEPIVQHGYNEGKYTSQLHALREVAAISFLVGAGYDLQTAHRVVESWEINESFYPYGR